MAIGAVVKAAWSAAIDPRYRYYYRQRRLEDLAARDAWARRLARTLPPSDLPASVGAETLERDGILPLDRLLGDGEVGEMRAYFETHQASDPYRPELGAFDAPERAPAATHVAYFTNEAVLGAPHALKAANDPRVLAAVGAVLGAKPTISYMAAWWSLPGRGEAEHAELYHRDYDDLRFVKLFLYLTDVDAASGPHCFVRGSHKADRLIARSRFTDAEVAANFPPEDRLTLEGKAGTAFLENTFGLHRGVPPAEKPRLIFQTLYSLRPYIGGPRRPVRSVPRTHQGVLLDPYINRTYCSIR